MCLAIPGKITSIDENGSARIGKASFGGIVKDVNLFYCPEAREGDYVLVHVGFAISVVDEEEAKQVFRFLANNGHLGELSGK